MNFFGKGLPFDAAALKQACALLGAGPAELWAVLTVETRGFGFFADRRPQILFERHVFHRLTGGRFDAAHPQISSPVAGGYAGGPGEYARLEQAMALDRRAALCSASWGVGQLMGFHHRSAGFRSLEAFIAAMVRDESSQLLAMARFIKAGGLDSALRRHDWPSFALGYNGPDFKKNDYDSRLEAAHARHCVHLPDLRLRAAQAALYYLGIDTGPIDGLRGRRTRSALVEFQRRRGLQVTGELDEATESALWEESFRCAAPVCEPALLKAQPPPAQSRSQPHQPQRQSFAQRRRGEHRSQPGAGQRSRNASQQQQAQGRNVDAAMPIVNRTGGRRQGKAENDVGADDLRPR